MQVASGRRPMLDVYGTDYPTPDGSCIRDFIHIEDLASAHLAAIEKTGPSGEGVRTINLGTGRGASVFDVVRTFENVTGLTIPLNRTSRRDGDVAEIYASCAKAKNELNWQHNQGLEDMLRSAWHAFESN
jgi:UDP-glucose 4-epimerase